MNVQTEYGPEEVTVIGAKHIIGQFGPMSYLNFVRADGKRYFWRSPNHVDLETGDQLLLWGRLKTVGSDGTVELQQCQTSKLTPETATVRPNRAGEPSAPFAGMAGRTWARVDETGSWTANILFIIASVLTLIPLLGLLIAVVLVPLLLVLVIVLLVRLSRRRGQVVYGTSIIKRNLVVTSACLVLASIGGGYQIALAVAKIVGSQ